MDLGVFGGTFNPVHLGHLRAAEEVAEALELGRVLFVPAKTPPHKGATGVAPPDVRLELVRLAVAGNPRFAVSDLELGRDGPSFSVDTLAELRRGLEPGGRLWFFLGSDAFREIATWHRYPELFALADLAVMQRPPDRTDPRPPPALAGQFERTPQGYRHASGREVRFLDVTLLDISSTNIRKALFEGRSVRYLVPEAVRAHLEALGRQQPQWLSGSRH